MIEAKAKEWVAALRSGKYKQGTGCLRSINDTFCCLGVLSDLDAGTIWIERSNCFSQGGLTLFLSSDTQKKCKMLQRAGDLPKNRPLIIDENESYTCLADANDSGVSFSQIADYIEANWEYL